MKQVAGVVAAATIMLAATASVARADTSERPEMNAGEYFLGTWTCTHTEGAESGTYSTTVTNALGSSWFKQTYDFAATKYEPAMQAEYFIGYDERRQRWVRFGAMTTGMYFTLVGKRDGTTWTWAYVLPGPTADGPVYTERSPSEYTIVGPSYVLKGNPVTEHHSCKKVS